VGQAFVVERWCLETKAGETSLEIGYGLASRTAQQADPQRVLQVNPGHWTIGNSCHDILDCIYEEDRSLIRTGYGPENITRFRRFAIGVIKSHGTRSVAHKRRQTTRNVRLVFDDPRTTENSCACRNGN
jgi:predicted transposase YbfD/YdcC